MTLIRQVWLMLAGLLLLALVGSLVTHTVVAGSSLQVRLQARNDDAAALLALALSQQQGDVDGVRRVAAAQFEARRFGQLRLVRGDGSLVLDLQQAPQPTAVPHWFGRLWPTTVPPAQAEVAGGTQVPGRLLLWGRPEELQTMLWADAQRMAGWLAAGGLLACGALALAVRAWRRPLEAVIAQAQALEDRRFVIAGESRVPELRRLTRSMNSLARRLQTVFEQQAATLEHLRQQAHADAVTGLLQRRPFVAQLDAALRAETQRGSGLLLVRLRRLGAMNRRLGHEATDRLLAALAQVLQSYPRHVRGALTGRLNGSDFGLYLPAAGMCSETAHSLVQALRAALATVDPQAELAVGGAELPPGCIAASALARCDGALAQAESEGAFAVSLADAVPADAPVPGERHWHTQLSAAWQHERLRLDEQEVRDAQGRLLYLHCPLQLQLEAGQAFEPESRWRAIAVRCRLAAPLDLAAVGLALAAIRSDGRPRSVHVAAASLATSGFVDQVAQRLQDAPSEATRLSIDIAEGAALQPRHLQQASAAWRRLGVRIGLAHAGARLRPLSRLHALGVDYVKLDAAFLHGVATQPPVHELARGLVMLLRGMQLQVIAESVADAADLQALWALGFDGAVATTG